MTTTTPFPAAEQRGPHPRAQAAAKLDAVLAAARYEDVMALARLPYFEARGEERLALADPKLGPAVDVHTHLALTFVRRATVDLKRETPRIEHYLPVRGRPIDLDIYQNQNYSEDDFRRLSRDLTLASLTCGGMRATHTVPNLAREMADLGIAQSVLLPIDYPVLSRNGPHWLEAIRGRRDFVGFASVHPYSWDLARKLDAQVALGARGVKVHPAVQVIRPDDRRAVKLYRLCAERKLPIFFHCGPVGIEPRLQRWLCQVRFYERPIAECPETTFVLGHSGALQLDEGIALAKRYPNVWLEVSSQSLPGIRKLVAEAPPGRLMFGTDWPFYPQALGLAKVFIATEGREDLRRAVLYDNAARLLGLAPVPCAPG